jgi:peptidoglycan/LPS O-acetylase OafA/YrhL
MNNLTKYRTELMGLAILMIIFYHSSIVIPNILSPLKFFKDISFIGVEIFFILSGLGLTFSYVKDNNIKRYFKKRYLRIIPAYWLAVILFQLKSVFLGGTFDVYGFIKSLCGIDFIIYGDTSIWFIPAIMICYVIFPGYWFLSEKYGTVKTFFCCSFLVLLASVLLVYTPFYHLVIFTIRLPMFFLGVLVGQLIYAENKRNKSYIDNPWILAILFVAGIIFFFIVRHTTTPEYSRMTGLSWYATVLMAYPLCIFLGKMFDKFTVANKFIRTFGVYSLELYLFHLWLFSLADTLFLKGMSFNVLRIPEYIAYVIIVLMFSVFIKKMFDRIIMS